MPTREEAKILKLLAKEWHFSGPPGILDISDIVAALDLAPSEIMQALKTLFESGLIDMNSLKAGLREYGIHYGKTVFREGTLILRPVNQNQIFTGANGIALLGEAAGWISPSSAEGFSYALKSALNLADALGDSPDGFERRYSHNSRQLRRNILLKNLKARVIFNPILRRLIMRWGIQSIEVRDG